MRKFKTVYKLVEDIYTKSSIPFAQWMWKNHVPVVAKFAEEVGEKFKANLDLAVAGALLHDFGDAFVHRHSAEHEETSKMKSTEVLQRAGYSSLEITNVLEEVIAPHSCKDGFLPTTLEGKIMATADAMAHLTTDFYIQFSWMHLPENKTYNEFVKWVAEKIDRDYNDKIFFEEVKSDLKFRYNALTELFVKKDL